jgi:hypothetical protein|tara:strand:+ start:355 stop:2088 length:1734 start_codon:yes stop_codon:yes gene_type:complete
MSVELGNREVQMITDAIKSVVNDAIKFGNPENFKMLDGSYMKNAEDWRTSIISNLIQGTPGNTYTSHTSVLFNHTNKIDSNIKSVRLETLVDYALDVFKAFEETDTIYSLTAPEFLWTGFTETSEAIYDIAMELTNDFGLEIPSVGEYGGDIKTLLIETSEALMGSDIKAGDVTNSLELQIRVLDDIRVNELYQMYGTFPSTEGVRPFMIQLIELHDQIDSLDDDIAEIFRVDVLDELWITRDPGDLLYKNVPNDAQVVKNQIKYFFEEMTDLQERYINFKNSPSTVFQPAHDFDIERMFVNMGSIVDPMRDAYGDMLFSSKEPAQFTSSFTVFAGTDTELPFQVNKTYMDRFQEIAGRKAYNVTLDPNYAADLNKTTGMTAGEFLADYVSMNIYGNRIDDNMREKLDRININDAKADLPYDPRYITPDQLVDDVDKAISNADGVENLNKAKEIMDKNPGIFKKVFSVLEKLDIGDQVITKAVLPTLGRMGVAGATGPLAIAYAGYETALLLGDIANSLYQAKTTDEGFWDNFGEVSDKYSIAYKISKPVYDIILGNLSTVLEQEDEEFIPQYNYGR